MACPQGVAAGRIEFIDLQHQNVLLGGAGFDFNGQPLLETIAELQFVAGPGDPSSVGSVGCLTVHLEGDRDGVEDRAGTTPQNKHYSENNQQCSHVLIQLCIYNPK